MEWISHIELVKQRAVTLLRDSPIFRFRAGAIPVVACLYLRDPRELTKTQLSVEVGYPKICFTFEKECGILYVRIFGGGIKICHRQWEKSSSAYGKKEA